MKIGILTYHCVPNFGAQLQTLSTVCYLRNAGHEPVVLNWYPQDLENIYCGLPAEQLKEHDKFTKSYFPLSNMCRNEKELVEEIERLELDAILLGSDALFKYIPLRCRWYLKMGKYRPGLVFEKVPCVEKLHRNPFFGGFLSKLNHRIPATVYAVSAQNTFFEKMTPYEKRFMKSCMGNFNAITVRDTRTQLMVESVMGEKDITIYPDPVFAFNHNIKDIIPTKDEIQKKFGIKQDYVLLSFRTYVCSDEYINALSSCIRSKGLLPVALTMPEGVRNAGIEKIIPPPLSPIDWYALIKHAYGYVGERMHPIVVALHNSTPCFSFDEYGCGNSKQKILYPRPIEFQKEQSKIYHIVHEAGLDSNWCSLKNTESIPSPENVIEKIITFDKEKCRLFSERQYMRYSEGMSRMMNVLANA